MTHFVEWRDTPGPGAGVHQSHLMSLDEAQAFADDLSEGIEYTIIDNDDTGFAWDE